jgi:hypothetical protein
MALEIRLNCKVYVQNAAMRPEGQSFSKKRVTSWAEQCDVSKAKEQNNSISEASLPHQK